MQEQNNKQMRTILDEIGKMSNNLIEINKMTETSSEKYLSYIDKIEGLQQIINDNFMSVNIQLEEQKQYNDKIQGHIDALVEYEKSISSASDQFTKDMATSVGRLRSMQEEITKNTTDNLSLISLKAQEYSEQMAEVAKKQIEEITHITDGYVNDLNNASSTLAAVANNLHVDMENTLKNTFTVFDKELAEICKHLSGTLSIVEETTGQVPEIVVEAYDGMNKSFGNMRDTLEKMSDNISEMQKVLSVKIEEEGN